MYPLHISIHNIIINSSVCHHIIPYHLHNHTIPTIPFQSSEQQPCYKAFAIHKFLNRKECKSLSKCVFSFEMENKMKNQPTIGHTHPAYPAKALLWCEMWILWAQGGGRGSNSRLFFNICISFDLQFLSYSHSHTDVHCFIWITQKPRNTWNENVLMIFCQ